MDLLRVVRLKNNGNNSFLLRLTVNNKVLKPYHFKNTIVEYATPKTNNLII